LEEEKRSVNRENVEDVPSGLRKGGIPLESMRYLKE
jgi:hypothetical protein